MNRRPLSQLNLPNLPSVNNLDDWEISDPPPVSLKHLSQNLSFLQRQYHMKTKLKKPQKNRLEKENVKSQSVPIRKNHQKQCSELPKIFSSNYEIDVNVKKRKRWSSVVKEMSLFLQKEEESSSPGKENQKRGGKEFSQMVGQFPLEGKEDHVFLHKHKVMNISRALNLSKLRTKGSHKAFYSAVENDVSRHENIKTSAFQDVVAIQ